MSKFLPVFLLINILLSAYYTDLWENANTISRALPVVTFYESGSFRIDKYHELTCDKAYINGHYYTDKAPLPTLIVLPFFGLLNRMGMIKQNENGSLYGNHIYALGGFLTGSIPFVAILLLTLMAIQKNLVLSPPIMAMLPYFASFIFVFSGTYFAHLLSGMLLLLSYIHIRKDNFVLSGFMAGLAFLSEYNLAVFYMAWGILMIFRGQFKPLIRFSFGVLPSLVFITIYNYIFTGSPLTMLYKFHNFDPLHQNYGFTFPGVQSLIGLSFSWYKGIFFYAPILLLVLIILVRNFRKIGFVRLLNNDVVVPSVVYFLFIASYFAWWGGWTHGPRLLLALAVLLIYCGIQVLIRFGCNKYLLWAFIAAGLIINFAAKATLVYSVPTEEKNPIFGLIFRQLFKGELHSNNLLTIIFDTHPSVAFLIFISIFVLSTIFLHQLYKKWVSQ